MTCFTRLELELRTDGGNIPVTNCKLRLIQVMQLKAIIIQSLLNFYRVLCTQNLIENEAKNNDHDFSENQQSYMERNIFLVKFSFISFWGYSRKIVHIVSPVQPPNI